MRAALANFFKQGNRVLLLIAAPAALLLVLLSLRLLARARTFQLFGTIVSQVPVDQRVVALTFDDGPRDGVVDSLLAVLRARGARATFFVTGRQLAESRGAGAKLLAAGHELANHTYSHRRMVLVSPARIRE